MDPRTFAAERHARLKAGDGHIRPTVEEGLAAYSRGEADWSDVIVDAAAQIWLENYQAESPGRPFARPLARFRTELADTLDLTTEPDGEVTDAQVDRITRWLSTYATNAGTIVGAFGHGERFKRWTTMQDEAVRDSHEAVDGQIRPIGSTFNVAGTKLGFPGEPVGPPEVWINCRCVLMPAARQGEAMGANTYVIGPEDEVDENPDVVEGYDAFASQTDPADIAVEPPDEEDLVPDVPEDDEELITEIPVHGVLAPEGISTGDGRKFAIGALSTRQLPLPLRYEVTSTHGGSTSDVVTVGRIDDAWRDDESDMWRFKGVVVLTKPHAQEVIDGIVDGTVRGTSIDGDDAEVEVMPMGEDPDGEDMMDALLAMMNPEETVFSKMRVAGLTIVAIPAFQEAYIALGHDFQEDLSDEEQAAQVAALQACGCLDGWDVVDLTDSPEENARAALEYEMFRDFPQAERDKAADAGHALPDGSFPIENCDDLKNAIQAIGRAKDPDKAKAHIKSRASALSCPDVEIPEGWSVTAVALSQDSVTFAPGTKDGPGWITHPVPTARIRRYWVRGEGAAKIAWGAPGDFNRCRKQLAKYVQNPDWLAGLCANMHYEALGFWPAQHHGSRVITAAGSKLRSQAARLTPVADVVFPSEWFQNPSLDRPLPLRIEKDTRRVYGYVAEWGVCHIGIDGFCQDVPRSYSDYGYYRKGIVDTDAGEQPVGIISYGTGHANPYARISAATAHYDDPTSVVAWVNLGEDEYGIWFSGVLAPWATDEDVAAMRAVGAVSGDWREIRGELELIGIPVVNTPGFPIKTLAASGGRQISLIGAGALPREEEEIPDGSAELVQELVSRVMHQTKLAARAADARATVRAQRLAAARAQLERI